MEINIKINVGENPSVDLISRLFSTAIALDQPAIIRQVRVGDISHTEYPAQTETKTQTLFQAVADDAAAKDYHAMAENAEQAGDGEGDEGDGEGDGTAVDPTAPPGAPKKKGRKSNAQKAAEKAAAEAAAASMVAGANASVAPPATPAITLPPGASGNVTPITPSGFTLPPGVTMQQQPQQVQQPVQQVQQPTHTPAAMPAVPPGAQPTGGVPSFEAFRDAYLQINTRLPGKPFAVLKSTTWPDGTPKQGWFTAEGVPPEFRLPLLEIWSTLT